METKEKKSSSKSGISLVVLLITIIVALILLSASTVKILDASENATISSFAEELRNLEESAKEYYLQNNTMPIIDEIAKDTLLNLSGSVNKEELKKEIENNFDNNENTKFYKLDLSKLNVATTSRGVMKKGNERDIYVIAYPSFRIYYLDGVEAKNEIYFSLSSKMSAINIVNANLQNSDIDNANISVSSGITGKKDTEDMTSNIGITISTYIEDYTTEKLYVSLLGDDKFTPLSVKKNGFFSVKINSVDEIYTDDEDINKFNALSKDQKYMQVKKEKNGIKISEEKIELSNYDNSRPYIVEGSVNLKKNSSTNTLYFDVSDVPIINGITAQDAVISKVKEVRYEYLTKYNESNGIEENYYSDYSDFSDAYMKSDSKKASISSSGTVKINLPKDITKIKIIVLDNASNYTVYEQTTAGGIKIGYEDLIYSNKNYLKLKLNVYSDENISLSSIFISNDGVNFSEERSLENITALATKSVELEYDNILSFDNFAYLKILFNKSSGVEEKILKIDLNM